MQSCQGCELEATLDFRQISPYTITVGWRILALAFRRFI